MEKDNSLRSTYVRVSDVLSKQDYKSREGITLEVLFAAAERGRAVHSFCTSYLNNFFLPTMDKEIELYVEAFIQWADENVDRVLATATRLYDDELQFTGEYDAMVTLKGREGIYLLDIKTTAKESRTWPLQLAAYRHLCMVNGWKIQGALNVHLKKSVSRKKGQEPVNVVKAKAIEGTNLDQSWNMFHHALCCYDYFERPHLVKEAVA